MEPSKTSIIIFYLLKANIFLFIILRILIYSSKKLLDFIILKIKYLLIIEMITQLRLKSADLLFRAILNSEIINQLI